LGKALGGGFPIGAMITKKSNMDLFQKNPILGHITTFGGHPVIATAGLETLSIIIQNKLSNQSIQKEKLFRKLLVHPLIEEIRGKGLMIALIMKNEKLANQLVINDLLYEKKAVRITPPLTISNTEIKKGCNIILSILDSV
jgi:acetylornithine/succinyldiaminopimelate/putrescine aminotransferase